MKDGIIKGTGNSRYLKSAISSATTWEQFRSLLLAGTLPIDLNGINENGWQQLGTALNKENLLSDSTKTALGLTQSDPTVNDALARVPTAINNSSATMGLLILKITESCTWKAPNTLYSPSAVVMCVGGGGGGGTPASTASQGGGGGGGGYITIGTVTLTPNGTYAITVGAGGDGAKGSSSPTGSDGGTTSFGSLVTAAGGKGGSVHNGGNGYGGGGGGYISNSEAGTGGIGSGGGNGGGLREKGLISKSGAGGGNSGGSGGGGGGFTFYCNAIGGDNGSNGGSGGGGGYGAGGGGGGYNEYGGGGAADNSITTRNGYRTLGFGVGGSIMAGNIFYTGGNGFGGGGGGSYRGNPAPSGGSGCVIIVLNGKY